MRRRSRSHVATSAARLTALALMVSGALLMTVAIFADPLGIGGGKGFGWQQLIAAIVGLALALIGAAWLLQPVIDERGTDEPLE